jgi:hypothetical protein
MKTLLTALLALSFTLPACTSRNRVGHDGNTGDGGVESTATRYGDTGTAGHAARNKKADTARHSDTAFRPNP